MAGEQVDRANAARKADEARRAATTGGSYQGTAGLLGGLGRALRGPAAQFAEGLGTGGVSGGLDVASFQRQIESEVTKAVNNMFQTLTSAVSAAATRAIRDMQTQVNSVTAQSQLYAGMTPQAGAAVFAQPQRRAGGGTPAMQAAGVSPAMASGGASTLWPTGPIAGGTAGPGPTGPTAMGQYHMFPAQHTMFAAPPGAYTPSGIAPPVPPTPPPPGTGSPFAGYGIGGYGIGGMARTAFGATWPAGLAAIGAGAGAYYRGVTGALNDERGAIIGASRLQTLIGNTQSPEEFRRQLGFGPSSAGVSRYGYTQQQMQAAGAAYLPYAPGGGGTAAINAMAGFGEGTGVGLQGASQFMGAAARAGAVGVPGAMGISPFMGMTSAAMGASTIARPEDWMAGFNDVLRQQQMMTVGMTAGQTKALTGYYGALNTSGNAALAGTQGAAVLGGLSQGISQAMSGTAAQQTMWYQALGPGTSPALAQLVTEGGLSPTTYGGRTYDPLRQGMQYINRTYGQEGDLTRWRAMSQMFHISMPTAKALAGANLVTKSGQVTAAEGEFQNLLQTTGIDLSSASGASSARFLGEIANADLMGDPRKRQAAWAATAGRMRTAGISGVPDKITSGAQLAQALTGGVTTQAGVNQTYVNNLNTALQNASEQINTFAGNAKLAAAHLVDISTQVPGGVAIGTGVGGIAQGAIATLFGMSAGSGATRAILSKVIPAGAGPAAGRGAAAVGRGGVGAGGRLITGLAGATLGEAALGAGIGLAAGTAVGAGGSWLWNEHQKDLHKTDVNEFLADMKSRHIQGGWSQVSTGIMGLGHPGLQYRGARGSYTIDIGNLAHDPNTGEWYDKTTGTKVDLGGIGQPAAVVGGGGHGVEAHTRAATRRTTDLVSRVLDPRRPLPTSTEQQLRTDLQNFVRDYGNILIRWQRNALSSVAGAPTGGGAGGDTGGTAGGADASYGGDTFRSNTLGSYNVTAAQGTDISGAGLKFGSYRDVREVGPVFNVGAGNAVSLPEGGRYDATRSTNYNSIFVTPEGQAISFLHLKARKFSNNEFVSAGTMIGQGLSRGGQFSGTTSTGASWTGGMTDPGLVEVDVFNAAQGHSAAEQAFSRPEGGTGTGEVDVMSWLASHQAHGSSGSGAVMDILRDESRKFGIPLNILVAQATQESGMGTNEVQTGGGGRGLFQFDFSNPANIRNASRWLGQAAGLGPNISEAKARQLAMNNRINAMASGAMMKSLYQRYGSWSDALTAYNTGHGGTSEYASGIMSAANAVGGGHGVPPVEHPSHPHHQRTPAKVASAPSVHIGSIPVTVEITLPNGVIERIRGTGKFDGIQGLTVQTGHAKQVSQYSKSPKR